MRNLLRIILAAGTVLLLAVCPPASLADDWPQLKFDSRHSGNAPDRSISTPLGLIGAVPLSDAIFTSPVVADGRIFVVDGSGTTTAIDAKSLDVIWKAPTSGRANCSNVSSPAIVGGYLHFGTTAGSYYVLDAASGKVVRETACGEPIFSSPVVANDRVYFATLGSRVYAVKPDGAVCWTWDFVREQMKFTGDRFRGEDWLKHLGGRVGPDHQFMCAQDIAVAGKTLILPAGGAVVWLEDAGDKAAVKAVSLPKTPTLGLSLGEDGTAYRQWHRLDNGGRVEMLRLRDRKVQGDFVRGTETNLHGPLLSFSSVSLRGQDVYRCRPEEGFAFCRHAPGQAKPQSLGGYPAAASPILAGDKAIFGGLDGRLYVVPLAGGKAWSFATSFGKSITAPVAVCDGRVYFGCEDGYLYVLGKDGNAPLPAEDLGLWKIRSPLTSKLADAKHDRFTSFDNWANTNANDEAVQPPLRLKWIRRYEGTTKHFSSCGGGRMYTHTAEGQIFAVEQETGRLLWRRYFPGVHISYTTPLYCQERLLVPQAGLERCNLRCLDAATGNLIWEAPFAGSPSWNRQLPPIVYKNLAIYMFGTGKYEGFSPPGETMEWLFEHQNIAGFPKSHKPLLRAFDLATGHEVWTRDFSEFGAGGDEAGICLMGDTLYYSCYFGRLGDGSKGRTGPNGITAAINPLTGENIWLTTKNSIHGGCTISGENGRLYLAGYNPLRGTEGRHVWCLDARDGSLLWQSDPLLEAIHVVTIGPRFLFVHAQYKNGYLLDKQNGKVLSTLTELYKCSRFTLSGNCLLGPNLDVVDLSDGQHAKLLSTGPRIDPSECIGAIASNGRIFYTGHGAGLQASEVFGEEATRAAAPWERASSPVGISPALEKAAAP